MAATEQQQSLPSRDGSPVEPPTVEPPMVEPPKAGPAEAQPSAAPESGVRRIELRFPSDPAQIGSARSAVEKFCMEQGFEPLAAGEVGLSVNEALANVIRHAYDGATDRPIHLTASIDGEGIWIALRDWGNGQNPRAMPRRERDPLTPGGLGLLCIQSMMDAVQYQPQPDGMLLLMTRARVRDRKDEGVRG